MDPSNSSPFTVDIFYKVQHISAFWEPLTVPSQICTSNTFMHYNTKPTGSDRWIAFVIPTKHLLQKCHEWCLLNGAVLTHYQNMLHFVLGNPDCGTSVDEVT